MQIEFRRICQTKTIPVQVLGWNADDADKYDNH